MLEPLSSQLSRTLVAFTIEADDEFEHQVPHRTSSHGTTAEEGAAAPWLVSLLMWSMCMRFVPAEGVSVRSYAQSAWWLTPDGLSTTLRRMGGWWKYLTVDPKAQQGSPGTAGRMVRPTAGSGFVPWLHGSRSASRSRTAGVSVSGSRASRLFARR